MTKPVYLDYAAATPMDPAVQAAMLPFFAERFYNPSAMYTEARLVRKELEAARVRIAYWIGARPSEIIFTAGSTEANNLVVNGVMRQFPDARVVVSAIEHESVLAAAHQYDCREAPVRQDGLVDLERLGGVIDEKTALVSVMYANNEVGTVQPIAKIGQLVDNIRKERRRAGNNLPLYLHTDAAQAAAYLDIHAARLGVDFLTLNGGKIYGPKQSGVVYAQAQARLMPQIVGGGQERGLRSGTENVAGAVGLSVALELVQKRRHDEQKRLRSLQDYFLNMLSERFPECVANGSQNVRLPNNVHVTFPGHDNERVLMALDEAGIMCAAGSACSASNEEPSHVLRAMGLTEADAQSSIRFTMGVHTVEADIDRAINELTRIFHEKTA